MSTTYAKPTKDDENGEPSTKRLKTTAWESNSACSMSTKTGSEANPKTIVTWNVNGFVTRCTWNADELKRLREETNCPDMICLQEVRLKAQDSSHRGVPSNSNNNLSAVLGALKDIFHDYRPFWSLADTKYAGTCTLIHQRLGFQPSESNVAFTPQSALQLLLRRYQVTREQVGLLPVARQANATISTSCSSSPGQKKQTSMKSFFAPKAKKSTTTTNNENNDTNLDRLPHHYEGRFQFFLFPHMDLLQTYVPNNGTKAESFERRRQWDQDMKDFLCARKQVLDFVHNSSSKQQQQPVTTTATTRNHRLLLWCGDLNCAREYRDGTHWQVQADGSIYEWWTDETKCFAVAAAKNLDPNRSTDNRGIPGFTPAERRRLNDIIDRADLVDVWRAQYPNGTAAAEDDVSDGDDCHGSKQQPRRHFASPWDRPEWTWRGHLSKDGNNFASKYEGKGQRLDYFFLSPSNMCKAVVESCEILGYGAQREGLFCGSDHCAAMLVLKK